MTKTSLIADLISSGLSSVIFLGNRVDILIFVVRISFLGGPLDMVSFIPLPAINKEIIPVWQVWNTNDVSRDHFRFTVLALMLYVTTLEHND